MKNYRTKLLSLSLLGTLAFAGSGQAQTLVYNEEFDGTGNGYNPDSTTAMIGDDDWVDFQNRIDNDFSGNEGYFTAVGGSETVLAGRSNSGDLQVRSDFAPGIEKGSVGRIEIRARIDLNQNDIYDDALTAPNLSLFWGTNSYVTPGAQNGNGNVSFTTLQGADEVVAQADGWHLFIWNDEGGLSGGVGTLVNSWRLDAVNGNLGASFEVDYFKIEESKFVVVDPVDPIPAEFTLKQEWEWTADGDLLGWVPNPLFDATTPPNGVSGGLLTGTSTGGDPFIESPLFEVLDVESGRFIVELGIVIDVNDTAEKQLFWKLDGGGAAAAQRVTFPTVPNDGELHVVRVNFDDVINGRLTGLRYDPSNTTDVVTNIDYIRIYSEGPEIPFFPPPVTELDPETPLGPEFLLQQEWTFEITDDAEGWTPKDLNLADPNDEFTGVFDGSIFVEATGGDSWLTSPTFAINNPASEQFVIEIDYADNFGPDSAGQFFWTDDNGGPAPARSAGTPLVPFAGGTVRITMTNNVAGTLRALRIDSTDATGDYYGIDAVRIYTNGPPVSTEAPRITSFSYDSTTGASEAVLLGNPTTVYTFASSADLDFTTPTPITLTGASIGMLSGEGVETDESGNATVQFNLGTSPKSFVRAED
ncbi:hypothetical protein [Haloferula sp.]|uniref:hypothetical protein n=1 Tax=Haloferula sp. TaxID=2497595 RepID=UPI003C792FB1